jgi:hypothetical protein
LPAVTFASTPARHARVGLGECAQPAEQPRPELCAALDELLFLDHLEHGVGRRAGDRVADVGAAVVSRLHRLGDRLAAEERRDREAAAEALAEGQDVGHHGLVLEREHLARASDPGLDLVENQQRAVRVTQLAQPAQVAVGRNVHAAFSLDGLDDEGGGVRVDRALCGREIAERDHHLFRQQVAIGVAMLGLADHGERAQRPAVERALGGDELAPTGRAVRELQCAFDRLGARVDEEAARERLGGERAQRLGEIELRQRGLLADGFDQGRVAVPDRADAPARGEVHVLAAVHVDHARAAALDEGHRQPVHHR